MSKTASQGERRGRGSYHHGDLRQALLHAAEAELRDKGIEGFTLRGAAKRAGVSHAAPAHHFKDQNALLTALAEVGFRRFLDTQHASRAQAPSDPRAGMLAAGLGYIAFAIENPELFRLIFTSQRADYSDGGLGTAASAAFQDLVDGVGAVRGDDPRASEAGMTDVTATWAIVHGLAELMLSGRLKFLAELSAERRDAALRAIIDRALPASQPQRG